MSCLTNLFNVSERFSDHVDMRGVTDTVYLDFERAFKFHVKGFPSNTWDEGKSRKQGSTMCSVLRVEKGFHLCMDLGFSAELQKREANVSLKFADDTKIR